MKTRSVGTRPGRPLPFSLGRIAALSPESSDARGGCGVDDRAEPQTGHGGALGIAEALEEWVQIGGFFVRERESNGQNVGQIDLSGRSGERIAINLLKASHNARPLKSFEHGSNEKQFQFQFARNLVRFGGPSLIKGTGHELDHSDGDGRIDEAFLLLRAGKNLDITSAQGLDDRRDLQSQEHEHPHEIHPEHKERDETERAVEFVESEGMCRVDAQEVLRRFDQDCRGERADHGGSGFDGRIRDPHVGHHQQEPEDQGAGQEAKAGGQPTPFGKRGFEGVKRPA